MENDGKACVCMAGQYDIASERAARKSSNLLHIRNVRRYSKKIADRSETCHKRARSAGSCAGTSTCQLKTPASARRTWHNTCCHYHSVLLTNLRRIPPQPTGPQRPAAREGWTTTSTRKPAHPISSCHTPTARRRSSSLRPCPLP